MIDNDSWSRNPIDQFILNRMAEAGINPAPEADRRAFIRRLYYDLTGLPPSQRSIANFLKDESPDAVERLVELTLLSPRYGERWAQHWLDLVRYADSDGYRADHLRPRAGRYRDYVIRALNDDKPYDRFVAEQIAGDEIAPNDPDAITATGFLRLWMYEYNSRDVEGQWRMILDDITDTTADVFLGIGMQCARCHDHKFDPILQKDYYRLQAYFAAILPRDEVYAATGHDFLQYRTAIENWESQTKEVRHQIAKLRKPYQERTGGQVFRKFTDELQELMMKPAGDRTPYEHQIAELAWRQIRFQEGVPANSIIKGKDRDRLEVLRKTLAAYDKLKPPPLAEVDSVTDVGPFAPPLKIPGAPTMEDVEPGPLSILSPAPAKVSTLPSAPNSKGRRAELARWITSQQNPLTARVIVNRVWQYHFGRGLSDNASDLGRLGQPPSHPELLDWLAATFIEQGWSLKRLHMLITSSATYRQSSIHPQHDVAIRADPDNTLHWRADIRRLDAEQIRDSMLLASRQLKFDIGGPPVAHDAPRRSIYTTVKRNTKHPFLDTFDYPDRQTSHANRSATTTPIQSLKLINGEFTRGASSALAGYLDELNRNKKADPIIGAYTSILGRAPTEEERTRATVFVERQEKLIRESEATTQRNPYDSKPIRFHDQPAAYLSPSRDQKRFDAPISAPIVLDEFTIEAVIKLNSVYEDSAVRTIAGHWNGNDAEAGWAFGVTGRDSEHAPQHLVLNLATASEENSVDRIDVQSNIRIELNTAYYVAATFSSGDADIGTVRFYKKRLSFKDRPIQVDSVRRGFAGTIECKSSITLGGRSEQDQHLFDGLIDEVRYSNVALKEEDLLPNLVRTDANTIGFWQFDTDETFHLDRGPSKHNLALKYHQVEQDDPTLAALADLCHMLFNSNEFLYIE